MSVILKSIPRSRKLYITRKLHDNLASRAAAGPAEPGLDAYVARLAELVKALAISSPPPRSADANRLVLLGRVETISGEIDTLYRHTESYVRVESRRRLRRDATHAVAVHEAAFPDGLAHLEDPLCDERWLFRTTIAILRSPRLLPALKAIGLPTTWLDAWNVWLVRATENDEALEASLKARTDSQRAGQDPAMDFLEICVALRRQAACRAAFSDKPRLAESKALLAPLLEEIASVRAALVAGATGADLAKKPAVPSEPIEQTTPRGGGKDLPN